MEDIARLALVEQSLGGIESFSKILHELLSVIYQILENPHDYELRTLKSDILKKVLHSEAFTDYLKYIGFRMDGNEYKYPKEETLNKLRIAQAAIERKIYFCCGSLSQVQRPERGSHGRVQENKVKFTPSNILQGVTRSPLLLKIEMLFNNMIKYEDEELQELAREQIPLVTLQLMALDRVREQQKKIKTGETTEHDMSFDIALLLELLGWFKHKFFTWVDKPPCKVCSGTTTYIGSREATVETENCTVEFYECSSCHAQISFPRHNDPRILLRTRKGRCGEWANCFTLMCRAMSYDTRYVYDTTDHVWCEVFDTESNQWLHVDPCEGKLNTPLMYCHGWGKKLSYVIAVSRDDLQDVTWRYTMDHKEVLKRRNLGTEGELIAGILALRQHRQQQVSAPRRRYLARRTLHELVQLMVERKPSEYESQGRISGSINWRTRRGEAGKRHTFLLTEKGTYDILYYTAADKYEVLLDGKLVQELTGWETGVHEANNVFRKHETDWQMVYLAREGCLIPIPKPRHYMAILAGSPCKVGASGEESNNKHVVEWQMIYVAREEAQTLYGNPGRILAGSPCKVGASREVSNNKHVMEWQMVCLAREEGAAEGSVSWRLQAAPGLQCTALEVSLPRAEFEDGRVATSLRFDQGEAEPAAHETQTYSGQFSRCEIVVTLRGGGGAGWQRAQLGRQRAAAVAPALRLRAVADAHADAV